ncbi:MAG: hypothetical protein ACK4SI_06030 [Brevundimonas aurantiaca]|uniref:hypothetical protein n=1 Tax=Brevundimonas aurantiaca TaxID=74316 RepID=UPI00391AB05A
MKILRLSILVSTLAVGIGVAQSATAQTYLSGAALPPATTYRPFIQQQIGRTLRDPDSARYEFGEPFKITCRGRLFRMRERWKGWATEVWVNARNGYGGYAGRELHYVLFVSDGTTDGIEVHNPMTFELGTCRREEW